MPFHRQYADTPIANSNIRVSALIQDTIIAVSAARKMGWDVDMVGQTASCSYVVSLKGGRLSTDCVG